MKEFLKIWPFHIPNRLDPVWQSWFLAWVLVCAADVLLTGAGIGCHLHEGNPATKSALHLGLRAGLMLNFFCSMAMAWFLSGKPILLPAWTCIRCAVVCWNVFLLLHAIL